MKTHYYDERGFSIGTPIYMNVVHIISFFPIVTPPSSLRSDHGTIPFTELFRSWNRSVYSTTKAQIHIYKYRYM